MPTKIEWAEETWRCVMGHPDYSISNTGRIWSSKTEKILRPILSRQGYHYVFLYTGKGLGKKMLIHRAVLFAFVGNPESGQECRHLDGNPANNNVQNLAWGTRAENMSDRRRHGRMPVPHESVFTKLEPRDIPIIRGLQREGKSSRQVAVMFGTSHTTIQKIWRGERWKGY